SHPRRRRGAATPGSRREHATNGGAHHPGQNGDRHPWPFADLFHDRNDELFELVHDQLQRARFDVVVLHSGGPFTMVASSMTPQPSQRATTCKRTLPSVSTSPCASGTSPFTCASLTRVPLVLPRSLTTQARPMRLMRACSEDTAGSASVTSACCRPSVAPSRTSIACPARSVVSPG